MGPFCLWPEIDISDLKLLGFETFANFFRVSVSVSENLVSKKSLYFGFGKFGLEKSLSFNFGKLGIGKEKSKYQEKKESRPSKQSKSLI